MTRLLLYQSPSIFHVNVVNLISFLSPIINSMMTPAPQNKLRKAPLNPSNLFYRPVK